MSNVDINVDGRIGGRKIRRLYRTLLQAGAIKRVSRWPPWRPSWISDPNNLNYFRSISHPDASYKVSSQRPFSSGDEAKNWFSRWLSRQPSWISDRDDFSYFWSTGHPDASYIVKVNKPFGSGEKVKNRFSRWLPWRPCWISNRNDFSHF